MDQTPNLRPRRVPLRSEKDVAGAVAELKDPSRIESADNPLLKKTKYTVEGAPKLYLVVTDKGAKYWSFRYRSDGKEKEAYIGKPFPQTGLAEAKRRAAVLNVRLLAGEDPAMDKAKAKRQKQLDAGNTFEKAANAWHANRSRTWHPRTAAQVREYLDRDIVPAFAGRTLDSISTVDLAELLDKIAARGAMDVAKKTHQWLGKIYSFARAHEWAKTDPVKDLKEIARYKDVSENYAHISLDELPKLLRDLGEVDAMPSVKRALWLILWTASRPGVTRTIRWSEIDLDEALWTIEAGRDGMKLGYKHLVPLPKQAVAMLREQHKISGNLEYVFIGRNDPDVPISDGAISGLLKRIGPPSLS